MTWRVAEKTLYPSRGPGPRSARQQQRPGQQSGAQGSVLGLVSIQTAGLKGDPSQAPAQRMWKLLKYLGLQNRL